MSGLHNLANRLRQVITKALLESVDDSTAIQLLKLRILDGEVIDSIERIQNYGFTSNPPVDSETITAECAGARDNLVALVVDSAASRIKDLLSGETCFYSEHGQTIKHDENGDTLYTALVHKFNDGGRQGARVDDSTETTSIEDAVFITWIATVSSAINGLVPGTFTPANTPTTVTGKITSGSSTVELPND